MAKNYVWKAGCTGSRGFLLKPNEAFDLADCPWLDIEDAISKGKAVSLVPAAGQVVKVESHIVELPKVDPAAVAPSYDKKGKGR